MFVCQTLGARAVSAPWGRPTPGIRRAASAIGTAEITQLGQTPVGPKDFAEWIVQITTAGTHRSFVRAQRPSVESTQEHTTLSVNAPTVLVVFGTNNCSSQTLASANGTSLRFVGGESNVL